AQQKGQNHHGLLSKRKVNPGSLGHENQAERLIKARAVPVETVTVGEEPVARRKATIWRGTPKASSFSMAMGKVASELAVAKPSVTGSAATRANIFNGMRAKSKMGTSTQRMNNTSATYIVASSFNSG